MRSSSTGDREEKKRPIEISCFAFDCSMSIVDCSFVRLLFLLVALLGRDTSAILQFDGQLQDECSVVVENERGTETCGNTRCATLPDPWRIIRVHSDDRPCQFRYLKLSFTSYDQLLMFVELQKAMAIGLDEFFVTSDKQLNMLDVRRAPFE
jgi:hypothetical protein